MGRSEHATTADGVAIIQFEKDSLGPSLPVRKELELVVLEAKTFTKMSTYVPQKQKADKYGRIAYVSINRRADSHAKFAEYIPDVDHRCQLLHHSSIYGAKVLYCAANQMGMLRVIICQFSHDIRKEYLTFLTDVKTQFFPWVDDDSIPLPNFSPEEMGRAVSTRSHLIMNQLIIISSC